MTFSLVDNDGEKYIDPLTYKVAVFQHHKTAMITSLMIFDQHNRQLMVIKN